MKALNFSMQLIDAFETVFLPKQEPSSPLELRNWKALWRKLSEGMVGNFEPRVWQETDRAGQLVWRAYDPRNDRYFTSDSEVEMRSWIEQRYYA